MGLFRDPGRSVRMTRRATVLGTAAALAGAVVGRAAATASVVGTDALQLRSDPDGRGTPEPSSTTTTLPLGAEVELPDGGLPDDPASGRSIRVRSGDAEGFAQDWYLRDRDRPAPYLLKGEPGCSRLAIIFNVGVGFEPDLGILDTLRSERVPAGMFVMGWWADRRPPALARMIEDGHVIGSHGYESLELTERSDEEVAADVLAAAAAIERAAGQPPARLFTPYAAAMDERVRSVVAGTGSLPIAWTVAAADYGEDATADGVWEHVMADIHDGALIEFHLDGPASAESTGEILPSLIHRLRDDGYQFVTVPEMLEPCQTQAG